MSSDARISEIRARLEKATVWPWQTWSEGTEESVESVSLGRFVCHLNSNMRQYREDAALIANAPADITYLLERLDALAAERDAAVARAERAEAALDGWQRLAERLAWHLSDQLHIAKFRFKAGRYGPASSYGDDGTQALADFRALAPEGMTVPRDYEGMGNRD